MKSKKGFLPIGLAVFTLIVLQITPSLAQDEEDQVLIKFKRNCTEETIHKVLDSLGVVEMRRVGKRNIYIVIPPEDKTINDIIYESEQDPNVLYAEPNYTAEFESIPNDPLFPSQYSLHNIDDTDIDATEAWDTITDASAIIVAVIDGGIDFRHNDLDSNIWINTQEIPSNSIDDDENGYTDDIIGWDFVTNSGTSFHVSPHATMVAGIIGAIGNNSAGIAGVCWNVKIMNLVANTTGHVMDSIYYAIDNGANIINMSFTIPYSLMLHAAIQEAGNAGLLCVAAAGNDGSSNDDFPVYPASYESENIISVANTDYGDFLDSLSNYGLYRVDLAAPGVDILSTYDVTEGDESTYDINTGTSFSAPHVVGAAALVWARNPALNHLYIKDKILAGVDKKDNLRGMVFTDGRLNLNNSLSASISIPNNGENLALNTIVTASSEYSSQYGADKAIDGSYGLWDSGEWASRGEMRPWIRFEWATEQLINKIILYDRPNRYDQILSGRLVFNDGTVLNFGMLPYGGAGKEIVFPTKTVRWVRLEVLEGTGYNVGLSEFQAYYIPSPAVDHNLAAAYWYTYTSASSEYSDNYDSDLIIDESYGLWDSGEWASNGEMRPWIRISWLYPQRINKIILFDRPNRYDQILNGRLIFSDDTVINFGMLPYGGMGKEIVFPTKTVDWIRLEVLEGTGYNVGLSEFQAYYIPEEIAVNNLALQCTVTSSSEYSAQYSADKAIDGSFGIWDVGEWASRGEMNPWIRFEWPSERLINKIVLYDRPNRYDQIMSGRLIFSDGSALNFGMLPYGGAGKEIVFPAKNVSWVRLEVLEGTGYNVGLSEFQAYYTP